MFEEFLELVDLIQEMKKYCAIAVAKRVGSIKIALAVDSSNILTLVNLVCHPLHTTLETVPM